MAAAPITYAPQKKQGFWSKLGQGFVRHAPTIRRALGYVAATAGSPQLLQQIQAEDEMDMEKQRQASALETQALNRQLLQKQVDAFETPEQQEVRRLGFLRKQGELEQELAAPQTIQQGNRLLERRYDPQSKQYVMGDPLMLQPPLSVPMGGRGMPVQESQPMQLPPQREPMLLRPKLAPALSTTEQTPEGKFTEIQRDEFGQEVQRVPTVPPQVITAQNRPPKTSQEEILDRMIKLEDLRQRNREKMEELRSTNRFTRQQEAALSKIDQATAIMDELERQAQLPENQQLFQSWMKNPRQKLANWFQTASGTLTPAQKDFVRLLNTSYAQIRKEIAGVAVTPYEGKLAEQAFPNLELPSYGDFQSALKASRLFQESLREAKLSRSDAGGPKPGAGNDPLGIR